MALPSLDIIAGLLGIMFFGAILGAVACLPYANKDKRFPFELLTKDLIWNLIPDVPLAATAAVACIFFCFLLVSGYFIR